METADDAERRLCDSMLATITIDNLMSKPSVFTLEEDLIVRKYKSMLYDDKRSAEKQQKRAQEGKTVYVHEKPRPNRLKIEQNIERLKVKYAVLKELITVEQAIKYYNCEWMDSAEVARLQAQKGRRVRKVLNSENKEELLQKIDYIQNKLDKLLEKVERV